MMIRILIIGMTFFSSFTYAKTQNKNIKLENGIVYLPLEGVRVTAGYGNIKNVTKNNIKISIVSAEGFKAVELHETSEKDGMMKMQKVDSFEILKNKSLNLKPGGHHIMLFDPTSKFEEGQLIPITFTDGKQNFNLDFKIQSRDHSKKSDDHKHHHH